MVREGSGPEVLLVHGGAAPSATWNGLASLSERWTLAYAYRRGYPPSPPTDRQDFEVDAADLAPLLGGRPHVVAHSYGTLAALLAAEREPENVRSLTLLEPPLAHYVGPDPEVAEFERIGDEILTRGLDADPETVRTFVRVAGARAIDDGPLPESVARGVRRAHGGRLPREARPSLEALRDAGVPALVASGDHFPAIERICDMAAQRLGARRIIAPGAGHFVAAAPGFAAELERFMRAAG